MAGSRKNKSLTISRGNKSEPSDQRFYSFRLFVCFCFVVLYEQLPLPRRIYLFFCCYPNFNKDFWKGTDYILRNATIKAIFVSFIHIAGLLGHLFISDA